ncbi:hypothetical protein COV61_04960 [Candidatus Micrarchaeota archaeon CG11_big_fil_rev_8_21_14_0_20_47_5]|nr:MAG: hypothetical protein COV61_04960 [Candidatus Micrarchaeota archaeon CG11_big_fil_rev_8_21_14_0_20_47_5]
MKYLKEFRERFAKREVFTSRDVKMYLGEMGASDEYVNLLLHNLVKRGEIKRIKKGAYTFSDEITCVGFAYSPFYYGLQDALSVHNLWEQEANPIVITPRRVRQGMRSFEGRNYLVRRIERKMFFGFGQKKCSGRVLPVSDMEKTLIDFFYFRERLSGEVVKEMKGKVKRKVLEEYLKRCPKRIAGIVKNALRHKAVE